MTEERLALTPVDLHADNVALIRSQAAAVLASRARASLRAERLVPAGAFAFAAIYLAWAALQAQLF